MLHRGRAAGTGRLVHARQLRRRPAKKPAPRATMRRGKFRLILDVGHTPEIPGAISARGDTEYNFNLRLANVIKQKLEEAGFVRTTLLLGTGEAIPSLVRRVSQANAMSADLSAVDPSRFCPADVQGEMDVRGQGSRNTATASRAIRSSCRRDNANFQQSLAFAKLLGATAEGARHAIHATLHRKLHGRATPRCCSMQRPASIATTSS